MYTYVWCVYIYIHTYMRYTYDIYMCVIYMVCAMFASLCVHVYVCVYAYVLVGICAYVVCMCMYCVA